MESHAEVLPIPRPLKRSASTASLASMTLPTPPRTRRRNNKRRALSRGSDDSASGEDLSDDDGHKNKRRRLSEPPEEQDNNSPAAHLFATLPVSPPCSKRQTRSTRTAPSTGGSSMASPPATPSVATLLLPGFNPQPKGKPRVNLVPVTAREKSKAQPKTPQPARDEEENPFLDSEDEPEDDDDPFVEKPAKKPKATLQVIDEEEESKEWVEPPTVHYVFRGVRAEFANPLWAPPMPTSPTSPTPSISSTLSHDPHDPSSAAIHLLPSSSSSAGPSQRKTKPKKAAPPSPRTTRARAQIAALAEAKARSELPIEHPEYEADIACKPKLLFGRPKRGLKTTKPAAKAKDKQEKVATTSSEWS